VLTFYFGGDRGLFGALHTPPRTDKPPRLVVFCAPLWREAVRAHRVLRQLAVRLAGEGITVLRFDYADAGDSRGDCEDGAVKPWVGDVAAAIDEAKRSQGVAQVTLLGLRFGASLAAMAAAKRDDIERLVLWEPVAHGARYLEEGLADHREWMQSYAQWRRLPSRDIADAGDEILGYRVTAAMRGSIEGVDLAQLPGAPSRVLLIERDAPAPAGGLAAVLGRLGARVDHQVLVEPEIWKPHSAAATAGARKTQEVISSWLSRSAS
jgi:alpha/beta superfamily hydrolase